MDILSHGLWAAVGAKAANRKRSPCLAGRQALEPMAIGSRSNNKWLNPYWTFFWGMFPDLFAFTIPVLMLIGTILTGHMSLGDWPKPEHGEPPSNQAWQGLTLASTLYQYSHSLVIFVLVMAVIYGVTKYRRVRFPLEMFGWFLHILMDIPTHTYAFFPTPVFWPISQWRFNGYSWAHPWLLAVDYGLLVLFFLILRKKKSSVGHPELQ